MQHYLRNTGFKTKGFKLFSIILFSCLVSFSYSLYSQEESKFPVDSDKMENPSESIEGSLESEAPFSRPLPVPQKGLKKAKTSLSSAPKNFQEDSEASQSPVLKFTKKEKVIMRYVILTFRKNCSSVSSADQRKMNEIQNNYEKRKTEASNEESDCYSRIFIQLAGAHDIYKETCQESKLRTSLVKDEGLARVFTNAIHYENGIRSYHRKLNECLERAGVKPRDTVPFSDYEQEGRALSTFVRSIEVGQPFFDNSVEYR